MTTIISLSTLFFPYNFTIVQHEPGCECYLCHLEKNVFPSPEFLAFLRAMARTKPLYLEGMAAFRYRTGDFRGKRADKLPGRSLGMGTTANCCVRFGVSSPARFTTLSLSLSLSLSLFNSFFVSLLSFSECPVLHLTKNWPENGGGVMRFYRVSNYFYFTLIF